MVKKKKNLKMPKLPFKKLGIIVLIIVFAVVIFNFREIIFNPYPAIVNLYKMRYNQMSTSDYLEKLRAFANGSLVLVGTDQSGNSLELSINDSLTGLNYSQLLNWEHRHLMYWTGELQVRPEMPIEILTTNIIIQGQDFIALGRCGEFSLLYNGLLLANGYRSRIVVDCSISTDGRKADDHVWVEIYLPENDTWLHCDPTEKIFNQPDMYGNPAKWNKCVNLVYGIEGNEIVNLTEKYQFK